MKVKVSTDYMDCWENEELKCPFCGYKEPDSWELSDEDDEYYCSNCERKFTYTSEVIRKFTSSPIGENTFNWKKGDAFEDGYDNQEDEDWYNEQFYCEKEGE